MKKYKITRKRVIKSCLRCYKHKLKCNKQLPCSNCVSFGETTLCKYGFDKEQLATTSGIQEILPPIANITKSTDTISKDTTVENHEKKLYEISQPSIVYKPKFFHPFFGNTINDKLLIYDSYAEIDAIMESYGNLILKFDKFETPKFSIIDVISMLPDKLIASNYIKDYFESIHPILPFLNKTRVCEMLDEVEDHISKKLPVNISILSLLFSIFFASVYSSIASDSNDDLALCQKYYSAFQSLLPLARFPYIPNIETLQGFIISHFIIDPNMVTFVAHSAMLLRVGQQLGLHKLPDQSYDQKIVDLKVLWDVILYIEGSSSVAAGYSFLSTSNILNPVKVVSQNNDDLENAYYLYLNCRLSINVVFERLMKFDLDSTDNKESVEWITTKIEGLYVQMRKASNIMTFISSDIGPYFAITLNIFLYRLHLRFSFISRLEPNKDEVLNKQNKTTFTIDDIDVTKVLTSGATYDNNIIDLTMCLLLSTYERLIQENTTKFNWYSCGSTVMQYIFVIIKDISQHSNNLYDYNKFSEELKDSLSDNIVQVLCLDNSTTLKFVLVDEIIKLLEARLVPLWNNKNLFKFVLIKRLKEAVWESYKSHFNELYEVYKSRILGSAMFVKGKEIIDTSKVNLDECLSHWKITKRKSDVQEIIDKWFQEFSQP